MFYVSRMELLLALVVGRVFWSAFDGGAAEGCISSAGSGSGTGDATGMVEANAAGGGRRGCARNGARGTLGLRSGTAVLVAPLFGLTAAAAAALAAATVTAVAAAVAEVAAAEERSAAAEEPLPLLVAGGGAEFESVREGVAPVSTGVAVAAADERLRVGAKPAGAMLLTAGALSVFIAALAARVLMGVGCCLPRAAAAASCACTGYCISTPIDSSSFCSFKLRAPRNSSKVAAK